MICFLPVFGLNCADSRAMSFRERFQIMKYSPCIAMLLCLSTLINIAYAQAATEGKSLIPPSAAQNSEKAERLLKRTCEFYRSLGSFSGRLTTNVRSQQNGKQSRVRHAVSFEFERSGYLSIKMKEPRDFGQATVNGSSAHFYYPKWHMYVNQALANREQIFTNPDFNFVTGGSLASSWSLRALTSDDPYTEIVKSSTVTNYDGLSRIGCHKCHQLTLSTGDGKPYGQLWLSADDKPWIRQFRYVTKVFGEHKPIEMSMNTQFGDMRAAPLLRAKEFIPPPFSAQVTHFSLPPDASASHSLRGLTAPNFKVRTVHGSKFVLSKQHGRIVVIEFWATWCAPCCRALPVFAELANDFSKMGVEFIAINRQEDPAKVKSFLVEKSLKAQVGLDTDGDISQRYRVAGIPHTVVIGRDGKIKFVHIGIPTNFKEQMSRELESIMGENAVGQIGRIQD